ncbi:MAG: cation diffusion facilitator family transporter [Candidatus Aminicenantes bacterium]|nr:cation diffusion facilitator family transporter [Candidatus Aminicenantes bacterium]
MSSLRSINHFLTGIFISDSDQTENLHVRVRYGLLAGWMSIIFILILFLVKLYIGIKADSISIIANAFHLLSHLANSIILVVSFFITARPATAKNPFGHGRMEHVAPLIMAIFLIISGIRIAEESLHQALHPEEVHYFPSLIWILLASILFKQFLSQFIRYLGERVQSHAILTNAAHHSIEAVMSLAVIGGLIAGHTFHRPELDGVIGIFISLWLFYLGYQHAREAIVPLLGQAPSPELIEKIRKTARSVDGINDVHEIIVHDYGSMIMISLHTEIPEKFGPYDIHEITERCERKLRKVFGGEVICHSDPLMEKTPEIETMEQTFRAIVSEIPEILGFHDFRVVAESQTKQIIVADIDLVGHVPDSGYDAILNRIKEAVNKRMPDIAYCSLYITPKFAY